jgi:hypothetical protein
MNVQLHPWSSARKLNCPVKESQCTILAMAGKNRAAFVYSDNLTTDPPAGNFSRTSVIQLENLIPITSVYYPENATGMISGGA